MEENCEDCMKWEEEIYWTHFQTLHFSKLLLPGFHNHLDIPQEFSNHCKTKLPETVTLKSPSGVAYNVKVEENEEKNLAFRCGWDKFVKDHSLEENDLLIFKFHRSSEFEVLVFDGRNLCEKPTSYFVRKCGHAEKKIKGTDLTSTIDDVETTQNQQPVVSPLGYDLEDLIDIDVDIDTTCNLHHVVSQNGNEEEGHINSDNDITSSEPLVMSPPSSGRISEGKYSLRAFKKMRGETSNENLGRKAASSKKRALSLAKRSISPSSKKRALSLAERAISPEKRALSLAERAISPDGFLIILKPTHVLRKCYLTIPIKWCMKNKLLSNQGVVMQVGQTKWDMKFKFSSSGRGLMSTGWKKFVQDNNLSVCDVLVFEPANSEETKPFRFLVYIFRAEETISTNDG